eukprot:6076627-Amphidinium_carterae.2
MQIVTLCSFELGMPYIRLPLCEVPLFILQPLGRCRRVYSPLDLQHAHMTHTHTRRVTGSRAHTHTPLQDKLDQLMRECESAASVTQCCGLSMGVLCLPQTLESAASKVGLQQQTKVGSLWQLVTLATFYATVDLRIALPL